MSEPAKVPPTPIRQPLIRDGEATRARIEREALRLFAEKGFDGTSIRDIALAVGVADAALYRYFKSKEALGRELFLDRFGALARKIAAIGAKRIAFPAKVAALVDLFCALFDQEPDVFAFILLSQHTHLRFVSDEPTENVAEALSRLMRKARDRGEITDADPDLAAGKAMGVVLQPAVFMLYGRLPKPLSAHAAALTEAALRVVGAVV